MAFDLGFLSLLRKEHLLFKPQSMAFCITVSTADWERCSSHQLLSHSICERALVKPSTFTDPEASTWLLLTCPSLASAIGSTVGSTCGSLDFASCLFILTCFCRIISAWQHGGGGHTKEVFSIAPFLCISSGIHPAKDEIAKNQPLSHFLLFLQFGETTMKQEAWRVQESGHPVHVTQGCTLGDNC